MVKIIIILWGGSDFFDAIGDPNQMSPFILFAIFIIYRVVKYFIKKSESEAQQEQFRIANIKLVEQKREAEEKEKQRVQAEAQEAARIATYQKKLNESYFLEEDGGEKPYSEKDIKAMLSNSDIKLSTKIKHGYETTDYKPLFSFEEFNQDFKNFL